MERDADPGELYTVEQAARVLDRTPGRARQLPRAGDLKGEHEVWGPSKPSRSYARSAHAYRETPLVASPGRSSRTSSGSGA